MGRLGVLHAVALLRDEQMPPEEILTRVEMIDSGNVYSFADQETDTTGRDQGR